MGVTINWHEYLDDVFLLTFEAPWTWDQFYGKMDERKALIEERGEPGPFPMIIDVRKSGPVARDSITQMKRMFTSPDPTAGIHIVVGGGMVLKMLYDATMKVYTAMGKSQTLYFAANIEEAEAIVTEQTTLA